MAEHIIATAYGEGYRVRTMKIGRQWGYQLFRLSDGLRAFPSTGPDNHCIGPFQTRAAAIEAAGDSADGDAITRAVAKRLSAEESTP